MAAGHVADNPFHADCLRLIYKLRDAPGNELPRSILLKRMKTKAREFDEIIATLVQSEDLECQSVKTAGRDGHIYRLPEGDKRVKEGEEGGERR